MKLTKFSSYFVFISIFTFVCLFVLIVQKSYINLVKPINIVNNSNITPINPQLDLEVIDEIEKRQDNPEVIVSSPSSSLTVTPTATLTP